MLIKAWNISNMYFKYGHILSVYIIPTSVSRKRTQQQQISQEFLYIRRAFGTHSDLLEHYYAVNSLASRNNLKYNLCTHITNYIHGHLIKHCSQRNVTAHINIASGNDLVRSRNKALPDSMFTYIYAAICRFYATFITIYAYTSYYISQCKQYI